MFSLRIVWSVFPLKIFMGGSISPSDVTDNSTVRRFFPLPEEQTRNFFSLFFKIQFNETVKKRWCFIHIINRWKRILWNSHKSCNRYLPNIWFEHLLITLAVYGWLKHGLTQQNCVEWNIYPSNHGWQKIINCEVV